MDKAFTNEFCEMTKEEMQLLCGGGWLKAGAAFIGGVLVGATPIAAFYGVGTITFTTGCTFLDYACK